MSKNRKFLVGALLTAGVCTLAFILASCGERQETTKYYYSPSWLRSGGVVFIAGLQSIRKDAIGTQLGSSYTETVSTAEATGVGENFIFDVTGAPAYSMSCAPVGDYVAYMDDLRSTLFHRIIVRNIASGAHSGLDQVELAFNPGIKSFDWSSDGQRLVYCTTGEVRTIKRDGSGDTLVVTVADLSFVSWKYADRIAYVHGGLLSLIYADGSGRLDLAAAASVDKSQISAANTSEVFGLAGGSYCKVNVDAATPATSEILAGCKGDLPRLNPPADKVTYSKIESGEQSGIYTIDLTAAVKAETKIK
ncbi:MAG: hypothetical protein WC632_04840 [Candidatus Margulisiibacteriota bacterium]